MLAAHLGRTSMVLRYDIHRGADLVNQVSIRYVWVDATTLKPAPPPKDVREAFARHLVTSPASDPADCDAAAGAPLTGG